MAQRQRLDDELRWRTIMRLDVDQSHGEAAIFLEMWFPDYGTCSRRLEKYPEDQLRGIQNPQKARMTVNLTARCLNETWLYARKPMACIPCNAAPDMVHIASFLETGPVAAIRDISRSCLDPNDFTVLNCIVKSHASLSPPSLWLRLCSRFTLLAT
ncbi:hypothetical protein TNCV_665451 [Trichonephila clavipes]|uniref:Uncharacterized protein n=1 Tax=Trichonephila clavipes TaxID=2585209 RepID=A0A8X6VHJ5_TRICX|nr:hypothetical protein TNCV_665451 [Trichonephila clavipes]